MATGEVEINYALAEVLDGMRRRWAAKGEPVGAFAGSTRHPDVLITEPGVAPVIIETEFVPARTVELDARGRLGETLAVGSTVMATVALRVPLRFKDVSQAALRFQLRAAEDLEFALLTGEGNEEYKRFPSSGWIMGSTNDLANLVYESAVPEQAINQAATLLENGVTSAAKLLGQTISEHPNIADDVARALRQIDGEQTRRMAMTIVGNALVFHENLAGSRGIKNVDNLRDGMGVLTKTSVLQEWRKILKINYWPIFEIARQIVTPLPQRDAAVILEQLSKTSASLVAAGVTRSHDLAGTVFQRLVVDRKFLATFYTRPSAAALLAALTLPNSQKWGDASKVTDFTVADFACGTGTLLSAAYRRIGQLHEQGGGDSEAIHAEMMEQALIGADVMPMSVHLTASMLASAHPTKQFTGTRLYTLPYGQQENKDYALGSLDLLAEDHRILPLFRTSAPKRHSGKGEAEAPERLEMGVGECGLVIMNPPFTRPTNHEGKHSKIPNPAFAAFGADSKEQGMMARIAKSLGKATCANGNAGVASYFIALADLMVRQGGTVALVLPLTVLQGESWQKTRDMWQKGYKKIIGVTIAAEKSEEKSFSADTGMGEALVIAQKKEGDEPGGRGLFVTLKRRPQTAMEALEIARAINIIESAEGRRRLEDGPYGGTPLQVGDEVVGETLDCPITEGEQWPVAGIADLGLAQTAYQLSKGSLWLPGQPEIEATSIPMTTLRQLGEMGFLDRDINGAGDRGSFDIIKPCSATATYPTLWGHDAGRERALMVESDSEARVRTGKEQKATIIWAKGSRSHHNRDFRFNSQSLSVAFTEKVTLGGRSWPNVIFDDPEHEILYCLWGNSTLGLLCYWWHATKEQSGRGVMPRTQARSMPTLDSRKLNRGQISKAIQVFDDIKDRGMLPFNEAVRDPVREELDYRLITEVLNLDPGLLKPLEQLRKKLCAEPSVHGGKISKAVLQEEGH